MARFDHLAMEISCDNGKSFSPTRCMAQTRRSLCNRPVSHATLPLIVYQILDCAKRRKLSVYVGLQTDYHLFDQKYELKSPD